MAVAVVTICAIVASCGDADRVSCPDEAHRYRITKGSSLLRSVDGVVSAAPIGGGFCATKLRFQPNVSFEYRIERFKARGSADVIVEGTGALGLLHDAYSMTMGLDANVNGVRTFFFGETPPGEDTPPDLAAAQLSAGGNSDDIRLGRVDGYILTLFAETQND